MFEVPSILLPTQNVPVVTLKIVFLRSFLIGVGNLDFFAGDQIQKLQLY